MKKEKNAMRDNLHEQKEPLKIKGNIRKKKAKRGNLNVDEDI